MMVVPAVTDENMSVPGSFQDRRGFAGNGGFVDIGHALDHVAIRRHHVVFLDADEIALVQLRSRDPLGAAVLDHADTDQVGSGLPERGGFRLAAALGKSFRIIGKPDGQRQHPGNDAVIDAARRRTGPNKSGSKVRASVISVPSQTTNMTGLRILHPRIEFAERVPRSLVG